LPIHAGNLPAFPKLFATQEAAQVPWLDQYKNSYIPWQVSIYIPNWQYLPSKEQYIALLPQGNFQFPAFYLRLKMKWNMDQCIEQLHYAKGEKNSKPSPA